MKKSKPLVLNGFEFSELLTTSGLLRLDAAFIDFLRNKDGKHADELLKYREKTLSLSSIELSEWLIQFAVYLEMFLANLFGIKEALDISHLRSTSYEPI